MRVSLLPPLALMRSAYHSRSTRSTQTSTGKASSLSREKSITQLATLSPTPGRAVSASSAASYDASRSVNRSIPPSATMRAAAATYLARKPRPNSRSGPSPASANACGEGNAYISPPPHAMARPRLLDMSSTLVLMRGMLELDEQMKETRHSHGSWRMRRRPRKRSMAPPMRSSTLMDA